MRPLDDAPVPFHELLPSGDHLLRVNRWLGRPDVAAVVLYQAPRPPGADDVRRWAEGLRQLGYRQAVTSAMAEPEQAPFLAAGFGVRERLHLLSHALDDVPAAPRRVLLRRPRRAERPGILAVDAAAFGDRWRFDGTALADAIGATPFSRQRIATDDDGAVIAYAVCGRTQARGYLQRLAVAPRARRQGLGAALVVDALRWMRRHGAEQALVNTQYGNEGALALYEGLGFRPEPTRLAVLEVDLAAIGPPTDRAGPGA